MIVDGKSDGKTWPPGPYTEEQLVLLERGYHGRPTMQTVVAELRRLMKLVNRPQVGWPCGYPEPEMVDDPAGEGASYILFLEEHELTADDARGIGERLIEMADQIDIQEALEKIK